MFFDDEDISRSLFGEREMYQNISTEKSEKLKYDQKVIIPIVKQEKYHVEVLNQNNNNNNNNNIYNNNNNNNNNNTMNNTMNHDNELNISNDIKNRTNQLNTQQEYIDAYCCDGGIHAVLDSASLSYQQSTDLVNNPNIGIEKAVLYPTPTLNETNNQSGTDLLHSIVQRTLPIWKPQREMMNNLYCTENGLESMLSTSSLSYHTTNISDFENQFENQLENQDCNKDDGDDDDDDDYLEAFGRNKNNLKSEQKQQLQNQQLQYHHHEQQQQHHHHQQEQQEFFIDQQQLYEFQQMLEKHQFENYQQQQQQQNLQYHHHHQQQQQQPYNYSESHNSHYNSNFLNSFRSNFNPSPSLSTSTTQSLSIIPPKIPWSSNQNNNQNNFHSDHFIQSTYLENLSPSKQYEGIDDFEAFTSFQFSDNEMI